jgi:hypothetical protein
VNDWPPTLIAAWRGVLAGFACTVKLTEPLPDPLDDVETKPEPDALQEQPACVVTVKLPLPPAAGKFCDVGCRLYVHTGAAPSCVTLNDWPPTLIEACRVLVPGFDCTVKFTVPVPDPLDEVETKPEPDALHEQPACVVTVKLPLPPAAPKFCDEGCRL